ncbi:MAG: hypothetical protein KR126chlam1_01041 [Chlamydiae bacterium]|nr:hypothetical protein [Chlamydiota bacterium]
MASKFPIHYYGLDHREQMSSQVSPSFRGLTRYPSASLRELLYLSLPLILSLFSASFMGFCDRLFLARHSLGALEGSVSAGYLCILFQQPVMRVATMSQVFVGLYRGGGEPHKIGNSVWQMIWLSLLSMLVTLPLSQFVAPFFFNGTVIREEANTYFMTLMAVNFLFPLATTLTAYFIGQGRTKIIFIATLFAHGLNICLDYFFIFGIEGVLPPMGIFGAALATGISQGLFCVVLFYFFLQKKERKTYRTNEYHFNWNDFWDQLQIGLPRAATRIIILTAWVSITRLITLKGGDHLMVMSIGGTLILLFTFINDGLCQGMITIASTLMGSKNYDQIWKLVRSALIFLVVTTALLAIPYLVFPEFTLSFFFPESPSPETLKILKRSCIWLWVFFFTYGFNAIGLSLVTAARDVAFHLFAIFFVWLTSYFPAYLAINVFNWPPDSLWLIMAFDSFVFGVVFLIRSSKERWRKDALPVNVDQIASN